MATKPGSAAPFITEIEFVTGGRSVRIASHNFLQGLDIESAAKGSWSGTLTLYDRGGAFLEDLIIGAGTDRYVRIKFAWEKYGIDSSPLYQGFVSVPNFVFMPDGIILNLDLIAQPVAVAAADKRTRAFREGMTVSQMVRSIASDRGWLTADYLGSPTIEDTTAPMTEPFSSVGESDMKFIEEQLRPQAVNANGVGGYRFYFDTQDVCHFHTDNFLQPRVKRYTFARVGDGEVIMFSPSETSYMAQLGGAGNAQFRSAASLPGSQVQREGSVRGTIEGAGAEVESTSTAVPSIGDGLANVTPITTRDLDELSRIANDRRTRMSKLVITAEMDVVGTHDLRVLDYVELTYYKLDGTPHYLSGRYQIMKFRHRVDNTGWRTTFSLSRAGVQPQAGTVSKTGSQTVNPQVI